MYLLVNLESVMPRLRDNSASSILMKIPYFSNEDISFHPFPERGNMELSDLKKFIAPDLLADPYSPF